MSLSLSIHTHADHLDTYGEPDPTSAYSLSGYISITLSPSSSFFGRRRVARYLLQSLSLTFEGQSEIYTPSTGYSAFRLCSITQELVPSDDAVELSSENDEDSCEPCVWNIIFNMTVPGWLPASSAIGFEELGVRYGLHATAKFLDLEASRGPWAFATFCAPFLSKAKTSQAQRTVQLRRFLAPPSLDPPTLNTINYLVNNPATSAKGDNIKKRVPPEVLAKVQTILSVPEYVDMNEKKMDVTLRLRSDGFEQEECERFQLMDISLSLVQIEKCRSRPSTNYQNRYPLPPANRQPPNEPLLDSSPIIGIYDVGILPIPGRCDSMSRSFSLLPTAESGNYKFDDDAKRIFAGDFAAGQSEEINWHKVELSIPFSERVSMNDADDWDINATLRPTASMPLFVVYHEVNVTLTCAYTFPDSEEVAQEKLSFTVPVKFGKLAPPPPQPPILPSISGTSRSACRHDNPPRLPVVEPYAPTLPVYSQLYDVNGERKVDYSVPLPLYMPPTPSDDDDESTDAHSSHRVSVVEVVDFSSDDSPTRRKEDNIPLALEEEEDAEEDTPLLGTA